MCTATVFTNPTCILLNNICALRLCTRPCSLTAYYDCVHSTVPRLCPSTPYRNCVLWLCTGRRSVAYCTCLLNLSCVLDDRTLQHCSILSTLQPNSYRVWPVDHVAWARPDKYNGSTHCLITLVNLVVATLDKIQGNRSQLLCLAPLCSWDPDRGEETAEGRLMAVTSFFVPPAPTADPLALHHRRAMAAVTITAVVRSVYYRNRNCYNSNCYHIQIIARTDALVRKLGDIILNEF